LYYDFHGFADLDMYGLQSVSFRTARLLHITYGVHKVNGGKKYFGCLLGHQKPTIPSDRAENGCVRESGSRDIIAGSRMCINHKRRRDGGRLRNRGSGKRSRGTEQDERTHHSSSILHVQSYQSYFHHVFPYKFILLNHWRAFNILLTFAVEAVPLRRSHGGAASSGKRRHRRRRLSTITTMQSPIYSNFTQSA